MVVYNLFSIYSQWWQVKFEEINIIVINANILQLPFLKKEIITAAYDHYESFSNIASTRKQ